MKRDDGVPPTCDSGRSGRRHVDALLRVLAIAALCHGSGGLAAAAPSPTADPDLVAVITQSAHDAQRACHPRIHHDTYDFAACLRARADAERSSNARRLGIEYFAYVGAMNSERMGMEGARQTAFEFLRRFRTLQRRLGLDDLTLCQTVPGDCDVRIKTLQVMETQAPTHSARRKAQGSAASERGHLH